MTLKRVSPLLERNSETINLNLAPHPWKILKCAETGIVFLENPPGYEALKEDFAWEKTYESEVNKRRADEPIRYKISSFLKDFRLKVLKRNKIKEIAKKEILKIKESTSIDLLDVGCADGGALEKIISELPQTYHSKCIPNGIEISAALAKIAREKAKRGKWIHNNAVDGMLEFDNDYFDIVILSSFLEHEIEPVQLLKNTLIKLKSHGSVIIKVPNFASWNRHIRKEKWCGFRHPDHVNYFTPATLKETALRSGFSKFSMKLLDKQPLSDSMYAVLKKS